MQVEFSELPWVSVFPTRYLRTFAFQLFLCKSAGDKTLGARSADYHCIVTCELLAHRRSKMNCLQCTYRGE